MPIFWEWWKVFQASDSECNFFRSLPHYPWLEVRITWASELDSMSFIHRFNWKFFLPSESFIWMNKNPTKNICLISIFVLVIIFFCCSIGHNGSQIPLPPQKKNQNLPQQKTNPKPQPETVLKFKQLLWKKKINEHSKIIF